MVSPSSVNRMNNLMTATAEWGTGKAARSARPSAGKTGTSQDFRDAWFVGYTAELVAGAWFGNDDGRPMKGVTGGSLPARLWARVMARGLEGLPPQPLLDGGVVVAARSDAKDVDVGFIGRILQTLTGEDDGPETTKSAPKVPKEMDR